MSLTPSEIEVIEDIADTLICPYAETTSITRVNTDLAALAKVLRALLPQPETLEEVCAAIVEHGQLWGRSGEDDTQEDIRYVPKGTYGRLRAALVERDAELERLYITAQAVLHQLDSGEASDHMENSEDLRWCREEVRSMCAP